MRAVPRIRPAVRSDLDAVEQLEGSAFSSDQLSRRSLRYYISAPTACFLVLEHEGKIVGDAIVAFRRGSRVARLYSIAVAPGLAGQGLGRSLLAACEAAACERGSTMLRLEVRSDNGAARRLYERAGYRRFGAYDDYYEDGALAERYERDLRSSLPPSAVTS